MNTNSSRITAPVFVFLLFFCSSAWAQTQVGLRAGLNVSQVVGKNVIAPQSAGLSYQVGLFARTELLGLPVQPEFLVTSRRYSYTQVLGTGDNTTHSEKKIKSHYLDFPVLAIIRLSDQLELLLGPQFSLCMAGMQEVKDAPSGDGHDFDLFDVAIAGGASYFLPNGFDLSLRGEYGFMPLLIKTNQNVEGPNKPAIYNLSVHFTIGLPISNSAADTAKPLDSY